MKISNFWRGLSLLLAMCSCFSASAETTMAITFKSGGAPQKVTLLDGQKLLCNAAEGTFTFKSIAGESLPEPLVLKNIQSIKFAGAWSGVQNTVEDSNIELVENPVRNNLILRGGTEKAASAVVYDLTGRVVLRFVWNGETVDASSLPAGVYILNIDNKAIKFVKS